MTQDVFEDIISSLRDIFKKEILAVDNNRQKDELSVTVSGEYLPRILTYLRDDSAYNFCQLMDLCVVDYLGRLPRFEVVYHLLSLSQNLRLRVKVGVGEDSSVPSVTEIYSCAGWYEREAWDLFGIAFKGNNDLRRLLTDYGFEGHPLRKDFPLTGYVELRYSEDLKRIVSEDVKLVQEYRSFDFLSPWEGMLGSLPGDEKATYSDKDLKDGDKK